MMMRNMFAKYPGGRWTRHFSTSSGENCRSNVCSYVPSLVQIKKKPQPDRI
ncbi:unnamed protein product [Arabidopsis lyrata]|nr:unnamed protein product [Arabidopsis lyrata]